MSWRLTNCEADCDGKRFYVVNTDLSSFNGLVLDGIELTGLVINPLSTWIVSEDVLTSVIELISYNTFYSSCSFAICKCCVDILVPTYGCATLDFSSVDPADLKDDMIIQVTYTSLSGVTVIADIAGDFQGVTMAVFLQAIADGITNAGTGFTATVDLLTVIVCAPQSLGESPVNSIITVDFAPEYYLKDEVIDDDTLPSPGRIILGYTALIQPTQIAFANGSNLLYVPNGDSVAQFFTFQDFDGADPTGSPGAIYSDNIGAGKSTNPFSAGEIFDLDLDKVVLGYNIHYVIHCTIVDYDPVTGILQYTINSMKKQGNFSDACACPVVGCTALCDRYNPVYPPGGCVIVPNDCNIPPNPPTPAFEGTNGVLTDLLYPVGTDAVDAMGNVQWIFTHRGVSWGTMNIYSVDLVNQPPPSVLTLVTTIEINLAFAYGCIYDPISNSVFISGLGGDAACGSVLKVDITADPFSIAASVNLNVTYALDIDIDPVTQLLHVFVGTLLICKVDKNLNHTNAVDISVGNNTHSYNTSTGDLWIAGVTGGNVNVQRIIPVLPYIFSQADILSPTIFAAANFGCTLGSVPGIGFCAPLDPAIAAKVPQMKGIGSIYYSTLTNEMFVTRQIQDSISTLGTFIVHGFILEVYQIGVGTADPLTMIGTAANIQASQIILPLPSVFDYLGEDMFWQPSAQRLFITDVTASFVHIYDPITKSWDGSFVPQPNQILNFSYTDDPTEYNFFGVDRNSKYLSVISATILIQNISGLFIGDITCEPCPPVIVPPPTRSIPDPVKIFYQIKESSCDITVVKKFAAGFWTKVKELGYGVTTCCDSIDLEHLWLDKQISDLGTLLIPDITCTAVPTPGCCPWLPTQACQLIPDPFGGTSIIGVAGEQIYFARVVTLNNNGKFYLNQPADLLTYQRVVGFATQDAVTNQQVRVLISGQLINTSWSLTTGAIYYASVDGNITSTIPVSGISQVVGVALSFNTLIVDIKQPIIL